MQKYTVGKVIIGDKFLDELIDEEGTKWYPLSMFLSNILRKSDKISFFRDSNLIKYMKVIEYSTDRPGMKTPQKTWCIKEEGIKFLLRHMNVVKKGKISLYRARVKGFYEACVFFQVKIKKEKIQPDFINTPPSLNRYDMWSRICLQNDYAINNFTEWKKCSECQYFYPFRESYFGTQKGLGAKCLQCQNKNFKCKNKVIQFIYENNGFDLLYRLESGTDEEIVRELRKFVERKT